MQLYRRDWGHAIAIIAGIIGLVGAVDYYFYHVREEQALAAVPFRNTRSSGSIPYWPIGTEYRIQFDHPLTDEELQAATALNALGASRGYVSVRFHCEMSEEEFARTKKELSQCHVWKSPPSPKE